jgi:hypothetical protein
MYRRLLAEKLLGKKNLKAGEIFRNAVRLKKSA